MTEQQVFAIRRSRQAVIRPFAETYIFISLTAFGLTVVMTRLLLELTGYPQLGNSVLHIAHALWGGLLLFASGLVTLILANQSALTISAVLSGIGVGLFIDEVGKFITQQNDYFFAPAAPIIYSLFLVMVLLFLMLRRSRQGSPRACMYRALSGLFEVLDHDLDPYERKHLLAELAHGRQAAEPHIVLLADHLAIYLQDDALPLAEYQPGFWVRLSRRVRQLGEQVGRVNHYRLIKIATAGLSFNAFFTVVSLVWVTFAPPSAEQVLVARLLDALELPIHNPRWLLVLLGLQLAVGLLYLLALIWQLQRREEAGVDAAMLAALLSLTAAQMVTFYLSQFSSLLSLFGILALFLVMLAYRSWYLAEE
jgi:hypothetical protein